MSESEGGSPSAYRRDKSFVSPRATHGLHTIPRAHGAVIQTERRPIASKLPSDTESSLDAEQDDALQSQPSTAELPFRNFSIQNSEQSAAPLTPPKPGDLRPKDFSFLLRPEIYHPLTPLNVPLAFRNSPKLPDTDVPLRQLLERGHFRAAAAAAVQELTGPRATKTGTGGVDPHDASRIFGLLYTRLACLSLIDATSLAVQEAKALKDLNNSRAYVDETTGKHLAPWELRVLFVRLQAIGFGDPRRAVMGYHDLAREVRQHIGAAAAGHKVASCDLWVARLRDLALQVTGALIDMDDLAGAAHHLETLRGGGKLALCKALLWLHLGDVDKARSCAEQCVRQEDLCQPMVQDRLVHALCGMADADYEAALAKWQTLRDSLGANDELTGVNMAVCLLFLGRLDEGRELLEGLVSSGASSNTLLFNLSTVYELCTDKHRHLKLRLAERVADMDESPAGWEKNNADFRL